MLAVDLRVKLAVCAAVACSGMAIEAARAQLTGDTIFKEAEYTQSGGGLSLDGYFFSSRLFMTSPTDFDGGSLTYPGPGSPASYSYVSSNPSYLIYQTPYYASSADLDAAFPAGVYTSTATNSITSASQTTSITSPATDAYPHTIPALTAASYAALQAVNPSTDTTINFNTFVPDGSATSSYIFFDVYDSSGAAVYNQDFLPSSTTAVTIPAGVLMPSTDYSYRLDFSDRLDSTNPTDGLPDELGYDY
jgi:hypothetical protein